MILCQCPSGHREHEFEPASFGLCRICSHGIGAHNRVNQHIQDIVALVQKMDIANYTIEVADSGKRIVLDMKIA